MDEYLPEASPDPMPADGGDAQSLRNFVLDILETVVISLLLFLAINAVSARIRVDGHSMVPTFKDGEFVIVDKISYHFHDPSRGDVIVFHYPRDPQQEYIKRVIGLPGDQIDVSNGSVYVNGSKLNEPYINAEPLYELQTVVPAGELFVLGDNRNNSSDSHDWGTVPEDFVVGRAVFVYWPIAEAGMIQSASAAYQADTP